MLKTMTKSAVFSSLTLSSLAVAHQVAFAQAPYSVNGSEVPSRELGNHAAEFLGWGIGIFAIIFALLIWALVFWMW